MHTLAASRLIIVDWVFEQTPQGGRLYTIYCFTFVTATTAAMLYQVQSVYRVVVTSTSNQCICGCETLRRFWRSFSNRKTTIYDEAVLYWVASCILGYPDGSKLEASKLTRSDLQYSNIQLCLMLSVIYEVRGHLCLVRTGVTPCPCSMYQVSHVVYTLYEQVAAVTKENVDGGWPQAYRTYHKYRG